MQILHSSSLNFIFTIHTKSGCGLRSNRVQSGRGLGVSSAEPARTTGVSFANSRLEQAWVHLQLYKLIVHTIEILKLKLVISNFDIYYDVLI